MIARGGLQAAGRNIHRPQALNIRVHDMAHAAATGRKPFTASTMKTGEETAEAEAAAATAEIEKAADNKRAP